MCETNHGYFTISLPGRQAGVPQPQPVRGRLDIFGDFGGLPLYTPNDRQSIRIGPDGAPIGELDPGDAVPVIGYYENSQGAVWLEIGHRQWVALELNDVTYGQIETYEEQGL